MTAKNKDQKRERAKQKRLRHNLFVICLTALSIKLVIIFRIQGFDWYQFSDGDLAEGLGYLLDNNYAPPNAWYGADGESYLRGLQGILEEGLFSRNQSLLYWPAGYPILMWPIMELFRGQFFLALTILQSLIYTCGVMWFVDELRKTNLSRFSCLIAFLLSFNPTLSLNTIVIGYELPVVALSLISVALLLSFFNNRENRLLSPQLFLAAFALTLSSLMQPRLLVLAGAFFFIWALAKFRIGVGSLFLAITMTIVALAPASLIYRNMQANGLATVSTNLGITMQIGAGPGATGGYVPEMTGTVSCPRVTGNALEVDRALVRCVLSWYLQNPTTTVKLFWNKARFFWSPWFGPESNGTMARNPWRQNHPLASAAQTKEGLNLIYGGFGKFISWLFMLLSFLLLIRGFYWLWRLGDLPRLLAIIAFSSFFLNLITSMLTIGDNRFRIPSMAMTLSLQGVGLMSLKKQKIILDGTTKPVVSWPVLQRRQSKREKS